MSQQQQVGAVGGFSLPALQLPSKKYSLEADMATGWQPRLRMAGPIPLNFDSPVPDSLVERLTVLGHRHKQRVVYLGHRYASSFRMHADMKREYLYKHEDSLHSQFPILAAYLRKFYAHFKPKHNRLFTGMNPTLKPEEEPIFDSNFQSGNLDAAIRIGPSEYDLFMRIDCNTRGHIQWFNFTIHNNGNRKIKLNIVNFRKIRTLYPTSLKPFIHSSSTPSSGWRQGGINVKFQKKPLRYTFLEDNFSPSALSYNCLSFQYEFQNDEEVIQLAYAPPFTYSDQLRLIASLPKEIVKEEVLGESLAGLDLQLLTITDPSTPSEGKRCVLVTGRIHPGETCGSHMVKGFLEFICSDCEQAQELRKQLVFKVVPMLNPDGVTLGNFRTSLCGKDLNRMFTSEQGLLIPQVRALRSLVRSLKQQFRSKFLFFLDFHGHSARKNVFFYGPEYDLWEPNYYRTRILPKLVASRTDVFRYYSCIFRISQCKKTTARALFLKYIPHCYTVEASIGSYYSAALRQEVPFSTQAWENVAKDIIISLGEFLGMLDEDGTRKKEEKQKAKSKKLPQIRNHSRPQPIANITKETQLLTEQMPTLQNLEQQLSLTPSLSLNLNQRAKAILEQIREDIGRQQPYTQGGSDSQSANSDLADQQLISLHRQITISLKEFKDKILSRKEEPPNPRPRPRSFLRSSQQFPKRIEMIASLRKRPPIQSKPQPTAEPRQSKGRQWFKSRTQSIRKAQLRPPAQGLNLFVNQIKFCFQEKVQYPSPKRKRDLTSLPKD